MLDLRQYTILAIVSLFIGGGLLDVAFGALGGNRSTISRVWLDLTGRHPLLIAELAYALALFFLHLNYARFVEAPTFWWGLFKALICLAPVFHLVGTVALSEPADDAAYTRLAERCGWHMAALAAAGTLLALPAWWWGVPQHVTD